NDRLVRVGPTVQSETTPGADESYNGNREPSISRHPTFSKAQCIVVLRWPPRAFPCPVGDACRFGEAWVRRARGSISSSSSNNNAPLYVPELTASWDSGHRCCKQVRL